MQNNIKETIQQIESLKLELLSLPSIEVDNNLEIVQDYLRISSELMKAIVDFQVNKNIINKPKTSDLESHNEEIKSIAETTVEADKTLPTNQQTRIVQAESATNRRGIEVAEMLANNAISDLRSAFGLNERFYFANELFKGDGQEFVFAINEFNHLGSFEDAQKLINAKYVVKFGWNLEDEIVQEFIGIIKCRYS